MANLIITVIAIALVAIAALMGAYYGGAAFLNSEQAANASTVMNEAVEINGAWQAYLADHILQPPTSTTDVKILITGNYLSHWPQFPGSINSGQGYFYIITPNNSNHYYAAAIVGIPSNTPSTTDLAAQSCVHVIKTASGVMPTAIVQTSFTQMVAGGANIGTTSFGCAAVNVYGDFGILPNTAIILQQPNLVTTYVVYYYLS